MNEYLLRNAMETWGDTVYRLALCRLQNAADAEDVYQDVFLKLLRQQDAASWEAERTKAWLIRTTLNRCVDIHRFRLRRALLSLTEIADLTEEEDEKAELWAVVAKLPEKLRIPIHLHYGEGFSTEEIAKLLHIPAATVRTRLHRARGKLKNLLGGSDDEE